MRGQTILPASDALAAVRGMEHSIVWVDSREGRAESPTVPPAP